MYSIDNWFDRFCRKHPRLGIPNLMMIIVIGTVAVYLLDMFSGSAMTFSSLLTFEPYQIVFHLQIWRLISFLFVPLDSNPLLLMLSLYFYWFIGTSLEREWGSVKFTVFYGTGVLLNIAVGLVLALFTGGYAFPVPTASASYLNLSLFFAFATLFPDTRFLMFFIIPVKAKWLAWLNAALFGWGILGNLISIFRFGPSPIFLLGIIAPLVAVLNYFLFFWSDIMEFLGHTSRKVKHRTSRQTINFKQATREAQHQKGYIHKCAVCGKTDADFPNEEFRYCSKCNGYYCYCSEHIGSHVHIE